MPRVLSVLLGWVTLLASVLNAGPAAADEQRFVYHLTRLANAQVVLDAVEAHAGEPGRRTIAVVAHGGGVRAMLAGAKDSRGERLEPALRRLEARGVDLVVCANSLDALKIDRSRVVAGRIVQSGSDEIDRLIRAGYREVR